MQLCYGIADKYRWLESLGWWFSHVALLHKDHYSLCLLKLSTVPFQFCSHVPSYPDPHADLALLFLCLITSVLQDGWGLWACDWKQALWDHELEKQEDLPPTFHFTFLLPIKPCNLGDLRALSDSKFIWGKDTGRGDMWKKLLMQHQWHHGNGGRQKPIQYGTFPSGNSMARWIECLTVFGTNKLSFSFYESNKHL